LSGFRIREVSCLSAARMRRNLFLLLSATHKIFLLTYMHILNTIRAIVLRFSGRRDTHEVAADKAEPTAEPQPGSDLRHVHRRASSWATSPDAAHVKNTKNMIDKKCQVIP